MISLKRSFTLMCSEWLVFSFPVSMSAARKVKGYYSLDVKCLPKKLMCGKHAFQYGNVQVGLLQNHYITGLMTSSVNKSTKWINPLIAK